MKNLRITVNGKKYDVQVEEIGSSEKSYTESEDNYSDEQDLQKNFEKKDNKISGSEIIKSPMPGTIVSVNVKEGQSVSSGQVLVILEAMKMENEIVATRDGVVAQINVNKGESVESGSPLVSLK